MKKILLIFSICVFVFSSQWQKKAPLKSAPKNIDPVYMIDVTKLPEFNAKIILSNNKEVKFCCPKSMFDFYLRPRNYPEYHITKESDFKKLLVKDYLSGKWIDAKNALYVFGSRVRSPKGDDLIPVKNKDTLNIYMLKYGGTKVLTFIDIKKKGMGLIKYLDMP